MSRNKGMTHNQLPRRTYRGVFVAHSGIAFRRDIKGAAIVRSSNNLTAQFCAAVAVSVRGRQLSRLTIALLEDIFLQLTTAVPIGSIQALGLNQQNF
jgi:hypothetical protein